jgi:cystathionine gamma-lyase
VRWVRWPGLPDDPSYVVASKQMRRVPGVVTFELGSTAAVTGFLRAAKLVIPATSFGGLHTTADPPRPMGRQAARRPGPPLLRHRGRGRPGGRHPPALSSSLSEA